MRVMGRALSSGNGFICCDGLPRGLFPRELFGLLQSARAEILRDILDRAQSESVEGTDEAGLAVRYGYTVRKSIAYCYLPLALAKPGTRLETELFGERVGLTVEKEPLYDPKGERIKA